MMNKAFFSKSKSKSREHFFFLFIFPQSATSLLPLFFFYQPQTHRLSRLSRSRVIDLVCSSHTTKRERQSNPFLSLFSSSHFSSLGSTPSPFFYFPSVLPLKQPNLSSYDYYYFVHSTLRRFQLDFETSCSSTFPLFSPLARC